MNAPDILPQILAGKATTSWGGWSKYWTSRHIDLVSLNHNFTPKIEDLRQIQEFAQSKYHLSLAVVAGGYGCFRLVLEGQNDKLSPEQIVSLISQLLRDPNFVQLVREKQFDLIIRPTPYTRIDPQTQAIEQYGGETTVDNSQNVFVNNSTLTGTQLALAQGNSSQTTENKSEPNPPSTANSDDCPSNNVHINLDTLTQRSLPVSLDLSIQESALEAWREQLESWLRENSINSESSGKIRQEALHLHEILKTLIRTGQMETWSTAMLSSLCGGVRFVEDLERIKIDIIKKWERINARETASPAQIVNSGSTITNSQQAIGNSVKQLSKEERKKST